MTVMQFEEWLFNLLQKQQGTQGVEMDWHANGVTDFSEMTIRLNTGEKFTLLITPHNNPPRYVELHPGLPPAGQPSH